MAQQIILKRNRDVYNGQSQAIEALNKLTFSIGEPVIVRYFDTNTNTLRILLAIGTSDGYGPSSYRLIATFDSIDDLTQSLSALSAVFNMHEDTLANGTTSGHVLDSADSDLEFINGIAKLKKGSVALDTLEKASRSGVIGISSSDLASSDGQATPKLLDWATVMQGLWESGFKPINKLTFSSPGASDVSISSNSLLGDDVKISFDNNFKITRVSGNQATISFTGTVSGDGNGGGGGTTITGELNTIVGPVRVTGSPSALITSFSDEEIAFPIAPTIDDPVQAGDINDTPNSNVVPTVGYVNTKISNALAANDAMHYMGTFNPSTQSLPAANAGDLYVVSLSGAISGLSSNVHAGDMLICFKDSTPPKTPNNWQLVEVHSGTVMGPATSVDSNLVAFDGSTGKVLKDSGIKMSEIVKGSTRVLAGSGLELAANPTGELGQGDIMVAHSKVTKEVAGAGNVVTGIETNDYGHVTKITYGQGATGSGLEGIAYVSSESDGKGWEGQTVMPGYFMNSAFLSDNTLFLFAGKLPGTVKVNDAGTAKYLVDAIVGKNVVSSANEYPVITEVADDKLQLSVVIPKIDGGEF